MSMFPKRSKERETEDKKPAASFFDGPADHSDTSAAVSAQTDSRELDGVPMPQPQSSRDMLQESMRKSQEIRRGQPNDLGTLDEQAMSAEPVDGLFYLSTHRAARGELTMTDEQRAAKKEEQEERARRGFEWFHKMLGF